MKELLEAFSTIINASLKADIKENIDSEVKETSIQENETVTEFLISEKEETNFEKLISIKNSEEIQELIFEDNSSLNIDHTCADLILSLHEELDSGEKIVLEKMVNATDKSFLKVLEIAVNNKE